MMSRGSLNAPNVNGLVLNGGNFIQEMDAASSLEVTSQGALTARRNLRGTLTMSVQSDATLTGRKLLSRTARYKILVPAERRRIVVYGAQRDARLQRDQEAT